MKNVFLPVVLGLCGLGQAHAAIMDFEFSYTFSNGETLEGAMRGDLQADNDTILVTEILDSFYTGDPSLVFTTVLYDNPSTVGPDQGIAYLSGAIPTYFGLSPPLSTDLPTWLLGLPTGSGVYVAVDNGVATFVFELFTPGKLSIAAVPAPATIWLLGTGIAGLGGRRWLKRKIVRQLLQTR